MKAIASGALAGIALGFVASGVAAAAHVQTRVGTASAAVLAQPASAQSRAVASTSMPITKIALQERFTTAGSGWPDRPAGTAWYEAAGYRMEARDPGRFVAVNAPTTDAFHDGVLMARFHKAGGPPGGGYGLIVADQGPDAHEGTFQGGRFVVLEAGDDGTIGAWQRDEDRWIDLLPWTPSSAVRDGGGPNELKVQAMGRQLTFVVNDAIVGQVETDLPPGRVGVFLGGDGNQAVLEQFAVEWTAGARSAR